MFSKTFTFISWRHDKIVYGGIMSHLVESMAWKFFDELHPSVIVEPINV